jgi:Mor family transcriptional regulator
LTGHTQEVKKQREQRAQMLGPNPSGLCMCGCGERTKLAKQTDTKTGYVQGKPIRYLPGHNQGRRLSDEQEDEICRRYQAGENVPTLAKTYAVPATTLYDVLKRHGVSRRSNKALFAEQEE